MAKSAATRTLHGTRAVLFALVSKHPGAQNTAGQAGAAIPGDQSLALGIFETIEVSVSQDHFEPYILGRASPGEVVIMGQSPISVRLSGFRKIDSALQFGPYGTSNLSMNMLQDIITDGKELQILVEDRQTEQIVLQVDNCKVVSHNLSIAAKQPSRLHMELVGLSYSDESGVQSEAGVAY